MYRSATVAILTVGSFGERQDGGLSAREAAGDHRFAATHAGRLPLVQAEKRTGEPRRVTLQGVPRTARARWRTILFGTFAGLAGAIAVTMLVPAEYESHVDIHVSARAAADATGAHQGNLLAEQKVKAYAELLPSRGIGAEVVEELELDLSPQDVVERITASAQPGAALLVVTATDSSPRQAQRIADATADALIRLVTRLELPVDPQPAAVVARIVEPASLPDTPVRPLPGVNLGLGLVAGSLAGCCLALLRGRRDTPVRSPAELAGLTGAPNLGAIAHDPETPTRPLTALHRPDSAGAEAYRRIRSTLRFVALDRQRKPIVVTSALPGEGKSTVVCNLAIVLAQERRRVVVVEADLRGPRAAGYLGLVGTGPDSGLTGVLTGRTSLDDALRRWRGGMVDVLPSGPLPPDPGELLASWQTGNLLACLAERYEEILLDAPALLSATDAAVLGEHCAGALLAVQHGRTSTRQVRAAVSTLDAAAVRLLGTVITMTPGADGP